MILRTILLILLVSHPLLAQRVFDKIDLEEIDETLRFDVNTILVSGNVLEASSQVSSAISGRTSDLNFSPNVVFSPSSERGFVSVSGSDKVFVFNPKTGSESALLEVGKNPAQLTLSPDGRFVGVVSTFLEDNLPKGNSNPTGARIGSVSLIDTETLEVRTLNLTQVFFSLGNNILFSGDGSRLFVASAATDEILQIDTASMTESAPRLKLRAGTRPASMTMAPDFSFFGVVLVGSANLNRIEVPDSVVLINPATFQVIKTLAPKTGPSQEEPVIHDFVVSNKLAISSDGKYGLIADQQISAVSQIPELSADRAFLIDFEAGEFVKTFTVGGIGAGSYWSPAGKFVVVCSLDVNLVDPVAQTSKKLIPARSDFRPLTRPAFSPDGKYMYVAAPLRDTLVVFNQTTSEIARFVPVGGEITVGTVKYTSAPLELAFTPDGEVLVSVNFNANTIDLIQKTQFFYLPIVFATADLFTGVALTNMADQTASVVITGYTETGAVPGDDAETEDVVEYNNPRTLEVGPLSQFAATAGEILEKNEATDYRGWFDIDSDRLSTASFFMVGDWAGKRLDGSVAFAETSRKVVIPEVRVTDGFITELSVLNPNVSQDSLTFTLFNEAGEELSQITRLVAPRGVAIAPVKDPNPDDGVQTGIFPDSAFEEPGERYVIVEGEGGIIGFERYYDSESMATLLGFRAEELAQSFDKLVIPQTAFFGGANSYVNLINGGSEDISVTASLRDNSGEEMAPAVTIALTKGHQLRKKVEELFAVNDGGATLSGWILLEPDKPGLVGNVEIQLASGRALTSVPVQGVPSRDIVFSHVAQGLGMSTGLALLNPSETPANLTIEVFSKEGTAVVSRTLNLGPNSRVVQLLTELFDGFPEQIGGYVRVRSGSGIIGLELFYENGLEFLSAVPGQRMD